MKARALAMIGVSLVVGTLGCSGDDRRRGGVAGDASASGDGPSAGGGGKDGPGVPADATPSDAAAVDAAVDAVPSADAGVPDGGAGGTVMVSAISINGMAKPDFTCVADGASFLYLGSNAVVGCNNGGKGLAIISVGFSTPAKVGAVTEKTGGTMVNVQAGIVILNSVGMSHKHTITVTSWDEATLHLVGAADTSWDNPDASTANYGSLKLAFDVTLTR